MAIQLNFPPLYSWQSEVFKGLNQHWKNSIHVIKSKRQVGKSCLAEIILMFTALTKDKHRAYLLSPSFAQADKIYNELFDMVKKKPFFWKSNNIRRQLLFKNGSEIRLFSAEQGIESLQGYTCELLIIDEAAYINDKIINAVFPYVNVSKGPILLFSTPRSKSGLFYEYYHMGELKEDPNVFQYDWAIFDTSALLSPEKLEMYRKTVDRLTYITYYEGKFLDGQSRFFGDFSKCIKNKPFTCLEPVVFGIDWAGAMGGDYTAISIIGLSGTLYDIIYFNDKEPNQTLAEIERLIAQWNPRKVTVETNSIGNVYFGLLRDKLKVRNIPLIGFWTDNDSKDRIISKLQVAFQNAKITIFDQFELMDELEFYEMTYSKSGKRIFNGATGHHDDLIMSLAIGYNSIKSGEYAVL